MSGLRALQSYARMGPPSVKSAEERCELCAIVLPERHRHLVDLEQRRLCCACQPCSLLFVTSSALPARYRTIPDRVLFDPLLELNDALWNTLQIPVRLAFLFHHSRQNRWVAFYPSPMGATEAALPEDAWKGVVASSPLLSSMDSDVEALLCWGPRGQARFEAYRVPIDVCYELVAQLRKSWRGFDGGDGVRRAIADTFVRLRARGRMFRANPQRGMPT